MASRRSTGPALGVIKGARWGARRGLVAVIAAMSLVLLALQATPAAAAGPCGPPVVSVIACENTPARETRRAIGRSPASGDRRSRGSRPR